MTFEKKKLNTHSISTPPLRQALSWPSKHKETYQRLNLRGDRGLLLHGPPGCGKTCMVQQLSAEAGFAMVVLSASDVYSPFLGDSEKNLKKVRF